METMVSIVASVSTLPCGYPGASQDKHQLHVNGSLLGNHTEQFLVRRLS